MGIGSKISELLTKYNMNASELAQKVGVPPTTIYSIIKRDSKKADIEVLIKIAKLFNVPVEYFGDSEPNSNLEHISDFEMDIIDKYRCLDKHSQEVVYTILNKEYEHIINVDTEKIPDNKATLLRYTSLLNAAHQRTDIDVPENVDTSDDDIMDDDNF